MAESSNNVFTDFPRLSLFTETPNQPGRRARLNFGAFNHNPRITVFSGIATDKDPITAPMDIPTGLMFLDRLEAVVRGPNGGKGTLGCYRGEFKDGKNTGNKLHMSDIFFGKDEEGKVWILLKKEGKPEIQFYFGLSAYHSLRVSGGQLTEGDTSCFMALGHIRALRKIFSDLADKPMIKPAGQPGTGGRQADSSSASSFSDIGF